MTAWVNLSAVVKILVFGVLVGAGLPALFAAGARLNAQGAADGAGAARRPVFIAISWLVFALVLLAALVGVLFVARDFIGHHTGFYIFGAKRR